MMINKKSLVLLLLLVIHVMASTIYDFKINLAWIKLFNDSKHSSSKNAAERSCWNSRSRNASNNTVQYAKYLLDYMDRCIEKSKPDEELLSLLDLCKSVDGILDKIEIEILLEHQKAGLYHRILQYLPTVLCIVLLISYLYEFINLRVGYLILITIAIKKASSASLFGNFGGGVQTLINNGTSWWIQYGPYILLMVFYVINSRKNLSNNTVSDIAFFAAFLSMRYEWLWSLCHCAAWLSGPFSRRVRSYIYVSDNA
jgi:hypothetical protein